MGPGGVKGRQRKGTPVENRKNVISFFLNRFGAEGGGGGGGGYSIL